MLKAGGSAMLLLLLAFCGVVEVALSAIFLRVYNPGLAFDGWSGILALLGKFTLAAGVCLIAAGIWKYNSMWLLIPNGLALAAFGWDWHGPVSFNVFAGLIVVMAATFGALALSAQGWLLKLAGAGSLGFAIAFLGLVSGWFHLERRPVHASIFLWQCVYFGFSAVCMIVLGRKEPGRLSAQQA